MSANEYANLIASYNQRICDQVPKGFLPRAGWEQEWGLSMAETNKKISKFVNAGVMEMKKFRVVCQSGKNYPVPHYQIIK